METNLRTAVLTKNVRLTPKNWPHQEAKSFKKGTEVLIKDEGYWKGIQQYSLTLASTDDVDKTEYKVTRSLFQFTEKINFVVTVTRVSYSSKNIEVSALDAKQAQILALDKAGDYEFGEDSASYEVDGVMIKNLLD